MNAIKVTIALAVCLSFLTSVFIVSGQDDPPTAPGDWDVYTTTIISNQTIVLDGNLYVNSGGDLYLYNTTVHINSTYDGEFGLDVMSGGKIHIMNGSKITGPRPQFGNYTYWIYAEDGGFFQANDSIIELAGKADDKTYLQFEGDTDIQNTTIRNCMYGLYLYEWSSAQFTMKNTMIQNITGTAVAYGIYLNYYTAYEFENVTIDGVRTTGTSSPKAYGFYYYDSGESYLSGFCVKNVSSTQAFGVFLYYALIQVSDISVLNVTASQYSNGLKTYYSPDRVTDIHILGLWSNSYCYGFYLDDDVSSLDNCSVEQIYGKSYCYGIYASSYCTLTEIADVDISMTNSTSSSYGIYIYNTGSTILRCDLRALDSDSTAYGIYFYDNYDLVEDVLISNFTSPNYLYGIYCYGGDGLTRDLTIENGVSGYQFYGTYSYDKTLTTIEDSVIRNIRTSHPNGDFTGFNGGTMLRCTIINCSARSELTGFSAFYAISECVAKDLSGPLSSGYIYVYYNTYNDNTVLKDCVADGITGYYVTCADNPHTINNVTISNVNANGSFYGISLDQDGSNPVSEISNCSVFDCQGPSGYAMDFDEYYGGPVFGCSVKNVTFPQSESEWTYMIGATYVNDTSIRSSSGPRAIRGAYIDNVSIEDFAGNGIMLVDEAGPYVRNSSIAGVWGDGVGFRSYYVENVFINDSDIVGVGRYFVNNDAEAKGIHVNNCFFGTDNKTLIEKTCSGPDVLISALAAKPHIARPYIFVNNTQSWSNKDLDLSTPLIVNGKLTISNSKVSGLMMVTGNLTLQGINCTKQGLCMNLLEGSSASINGLDARTGFGCSFVTRANGLNMDDFKFKGVWSGIQVINGTNINIRKGQLTGEGQHGNGIRAISSDGLIVRDVNISYFKTGLYVPSDLGGLKNAVIDGLSMWDNERHIIAFDLKNVVVSNCTLNAPENECRGGMHLVGENVDIYNNTIINVGNFQLLYCDYYIWVENCTFTGNGVTSYWSHTELGDSMNTNYNYTVTDNYFATWYVLLFYGSGTYDRNQHYECTVFPRQDGQRITNCTFTHVETGLRVNLDYTGTIIVNNTFFNCSGAALDLISDGNTVYHNNFINNTRDVLSPGINLFSNSEDEGNYWDSYNGKDMDGDGKGDTAIPHLNMDPYPMVYRDGWKLKPFNVVMDDLSSVDTDGDYKASWSVSILAKHYLLQESNVANFTANVTEWSIPFFAVNQMPITDKEFSGKDNGTYHYRIRGVNRNGETPWSNIVTTKVAVPPGTPSFLISTLISYNGTAFIPWRSISEADNYTIEISKTSDFYNSTAYNTTYNYYTFRGLDNGTYYFRVRAGSQDRVSVWSDYVYITVIIPPATPVLNATKTDEDGNYKLWWEPVVGAYLYTVEEQPKGSNPVQYMTTDTCYNFTGKHDGDYWYKVRAHAVTGMSEWSEVYYIEVDWMPRPPTFEVLQVPSGNALTLQWRPQPDNTNYTIECDDTGSWSTLIDKMDPVEWTQKGFVVWTHTGLTDGREYNYRLIAWDKDGTRASAPSYTVSEISRDTAAPPFPSIVDVSQVAEGSALRVTWQEAPEPCDDLVGYRVYSSLNGVTFTLEAQFDNNTYEFVRKNLTDGVYYYFYVSAIDEVPNESPPSIIKARYCDLDTDSDNVPNLLDDDDDGDGYPDINDTFPFDKTEWRDNDRDGLGDDYDDPDDDNDGYNDDVETTLGSDPLDRADRPADQDEDLIPDQLDPDIDGDGYNNTVDDYPSNAKKHKSVDENVVFTLFGIEIGKNDLFFTAISLALTGITTLVGIFALTIKTRRFRKHKGTIQKIGDKRQLYDFFRTVCIPDIEKDKIKPNDAVLLRHEYSMRLESLGGGRELDLTGIPTDTDEKGMKKEGPAKIPHQQDMKADYHQGNIKQKSPDAKEYPPAPSIPEGATPSGPISQPLPPSPPPIESPTEVVQVDETPLEQDIPEDPTEAGENATVEEEARAEEAEGEDLFKDLDFDLDIDDPK